MAKFDAGKWAEARVSEWLKNVWNRRAERSYHRYPDARAARGALAAQPADFLVSQRRVPWVPGDNAFTYGEVTHLEVKETIEANRLPKDKLSQFGTLRMHALAGIAVRVLVYRSAHKDWVFFTEQQLFVYDECPPSFPFAGLTSYPTAADALQEIFK